jgi:hypothetical protein
VGVIVELKGGWKQMILLPSMVDNIIEAVLLLVIAAISIFKKK